MCANPGLGIQPKFMTLGKEGALELFHDSSSNIYITETLARQCKTEGELAALLSTEIGRIVSERAAVRLNDVSDRGPPPAVDVGNDHGGSFGPADGVRMMERAKYERDRKLAREQAVPPPPDLLARAYLQKAGYNSSEMDAVAPLLRAADGNSRLEKLMTITPAKLPGT
jgi:predicted Zn-dependent protease